MLKKLFAGVIDVKNRTIQFFSKERKGEINFLAILLLIAVCLIVTYPAYKGLIQGMWTSVQSWFTTQMGSIFK